MSCPDCGPGACSSVCSAFRGRRYIPAPRTPAQMIRQERAELRLSLGEVAFRIGHVVRHVTMGQLRGQNGETAVWHAGAAARAAARLERHLATQARIEALAGMLSQAIARGPVASGRRAADVAARDDWRML